MRQCCYSKYQRNLYQSLVPTGIVVLVNGETGLGLLVKGEEVFGEGLETRRLFLRDPMPNDVEEPHLSTGRVDLLGSGLLSLGDGSGLVLSLNKRRNVNDWQCRRRLDKEHLVVSFATVLSTPAQVKRKTPIRGFYITFARPARP